MGMASLFLRGNRTAGVRPARASLSELRCGADGSYDLMGGMGLIEYLSHEQMRQMFREVQSFLDEAL